MVFILGIYFLLTMIFLGITAIIVGREIKARPDFKMAMFGGTLNSYRYYRHLKNKNEKVSPRFKLFLLAHFNFVLCVIAFIVTALMQ